MDTINAHRMCALPHLASYVKAKGNSHIRCVHIINHTTTVHTYGIRLMLDLHDIYAVLFTNNIIVDICRHFRLNRVNRNDDIYHPGCRASPYSY